MSHIPDSDLMHQIVNDSIECGYIRRPNGWPTNLQRKWHGHDFEPREMRSIGGNCYICCIPSFGRVDDRLAVLIGFVFFIFSAIIAGGYAVRSTQSACQANRDLHQVRFKRTQQIPSFNPEAIPQRAYAPPSEYVAPIQHQTDLYHDAEILLTGRRTERTWVAIAQGGMCVGAALLTAALLATFIADGGLLFYEYGFTGAALVAAGGALYAGTKCFTYNREEQLAAQRISDALYPLQYY